MFVLDGRVSGTQGNGRSHLRRAPGSVLGPLTYMLPHVPAKKVLPCLSAEEN